MQKIVTSFATLLLSLTLWADFCIEVGEFIVEEKSLEPQVAMEVTNVSKGGGYDDDGIWHTECDYYTDELETVYAVSYNDAGAVKEVRELTAGDGLESSGTTCTAPGIYLFRLQLPTLFWDEYSGKPLPRYCGFTFVYHSENCPAQGVLVEKADPDYATIIDETNCLNTLADVIAESQKEEYQDTSATVDNGAGADEDTVAVDSDSKSDGCALTLLD